MKKRTVKILLIIALLLAVVLANYVIDHSRGSKKDESQNQGTETASEQTGEPQAEDEAVEGSAPLATLFFASDYQAEPGFDAPADTLRSILAAARTDGKDIEKVIICGDYTNDAVLHDYQLSPDESITEIRGIVADECPALAAERDAGDPDGSEGIFFVQGNHDKMTEQISPSGLYEYDDYLIYVLNTEEDFPWKQGKKSGCLAKVSKSSEAMKECFDKLIEKGETRPVFIAGHVPLHFTARTSSRHTTGDNLYSSLIFDVVNDAANDLDIVYMFGHNHSKGWDCYMGGSSVYKAPGDTILIPSFNEYKVDTDTYTKETLRFTYMNAGYVGYYMNCAPAEYDADDPGRYAAADSALTGTVCEIYEDRVVITRYDISGQHDLGHEGEADPYKGGIDAGLIPESEYSVGTRSPQNIERK